MKLECTNNVSFEYQLTIGKVYEGRYWTSNDKLLVEIETNDEGEHWVAYSITRFKIVRE